MKFSIKDLVTFTEEILNGKLHLFVQRLEDLSANKLVKKPKNIPHVISLLILAENFPGKK